MVDRSAAPRSPGARRPLGPRATTLLVVDVILVLTFVVLLVMQLVNNPGGADEPDAGVGTSIATVEPETTPEPSAPQEPAEAQALTDFVLPSGNIYCSMNQTAASCTIISFTFTPPELPEGCTGSVGNVLTISAGQAATFPCVQTPPTGAPEGTPVLDYGGGSTIGEMTCLSSTNGVFCRHNPSGAGFSLARAGYQRF